MARFDIGRFLDSKKTNTAETVAASPVSSAVNTVKKAGIIEALKPVSKVGTVAGIAKAVTGGSGVIGGAASGAAAGAPLGVAGAAVGGVLGGIAGALKARSEERKRKASVRGAGHRAQAQIEGSKGARQQSAFQNLAANFRAALIR